MLWETESLFIMWFSSFVISLSTYLSVHAWLFVDFFFDFIVMEEEILLLEEVYIKEDKFKHLWDYIIHWKENILLRIHCLFCGVCVFILYI